MPIFLLFNICVLLCLKDSNLLDAAKICVLSDFLTCYRKEKNSFIQISRKTLVQLRPVKRYSVLSSQSFWSFSKETKFKSTCIEENPLVLSQRTYQINWDSRMRFLLQYQRDVSELCTIESFFLDFTAPNSSLKTNVCMYVEICLSARTHVLKCSL